MLSERWCARRATVRISAGREEENRPASWAAKSAVRDVRLRVILGFFSLRVISTPHECRQPRQQLPEGAGTMAEATLYGCTSSANAGGIRRSRRADRSRIRPSRGRKQNAAVTASAASATIRPGGIAQAQRGTRNGPSGAGRVSASSSSSRALLASSVACSPA